MKMKIAFLKVRNLFKSMACTDLATSLMAMPKSALAFTLITFGIAISEVA